VLNRFSAFQIVRQNFKGEDMITLQHREEALQLIGKLSDEGEASFADLKRSFGEQMYQELINDLLESGTIMMDSAGKIALTETGRRESLKIIRRHRLAERLLHDVLDMEKNEQLESQACDFEHILNSEVTDSICTLLGHPRFCPDGKPIPPGKCCEEKRGRVESVVLSLDSLKAGEEGKVAYICSSDHDQLDRLTAMGLFPGVKVKVHQKYPSIVVMFDEVTLALDSALARIIYVRR
jgi:DtxR family Mn-dependent transcriptional regulator